MAYTDIIGAFNAIANDLGNPSGIASAFQTLAASSDKLYSSTTAPSSPEVADMWFDETNDELKQWTGSAWVGHAIFNRIVIKNGETSEPAIDISEDANHGNPAIKLRSNTETGTHTVTFGSTDNYNEFAWKFSNEEEFSWIYDTDKIFTIDKDGIHAEDLVLEGAGYSVDVRAKLDTLDTDITGKLDTSTYNAAPKIYYGDTAPTGTIPAGSLWYDNNAARLHIRHESIWLQPDRVEDTALKTALHGAVNTATDFTSLKNNLLNVLSQ